MALWKKFAIAAGVGAVVGVVALAAEEVLTDLLS